MDNFAISWRLRKTLACAGIFAYLILALAQYFVFDPYAPESNTLKAIGVMLDLVWLGLIVICCNSGARPELKKIATWVAIGLCAIILLQMLYRVFIWEYQGEDSITTLNVLNLVGCISLLAVFVLMIVFSAGGMRIFFGCLALLYTIYVINSIRALAGISYTSYFPWILLEGAGRIGVPLYFLGLIIPSRSDLASGGCVLQEKPLRAGVWGYVFISILCVFVAYLGFTTDYLADTFSYNGADFYNSLGRLLSGRLFETYIWTKVSWALYALVMMSLTLVAMFINSREGYKANAVILGISGGLIVMTSLVGIFIDQMSFNFSSVAIAFTAVYSLIVLVCSLVTIMVSKSAVEHGAVKYLAFGAAYFLLFMLAVYTEMSRYNEECRNCFILMLGMLMYIPAGLKYACPRIPAAVNVAVTGTILVLASLLLSTGLDVLTHHH